MTLPANLPKCVLYWGIDIEGDGLHVTDSTFSGRPFVGFWDHVSDASTAWVLPTDPVEVEAFLRAVLDATGCEMVDAYGESRVDAWEVAKRSE